MELGPILNFYFLFGFHLIKLIINTSINKNKLIQCPIYKTREKEKKPQGK